MKRLVVALATSAFIMTTGVGAMAQDSGLGAQQQQAIDRNLEKDGNKKTATAKQKQAARQAAERKAAALATAKKSLKKPPVAMKPAPKKT